MMMLRIPYSQHAKPNTNSASSLQKKNTTTRDAAEHAEHSLLDQTDTSSPSKPRCAPICAPCKNYINLPTNPMRRPRRPHSSAARVPPPALHSKNMSSQFGAWAHVCRSKKTALVRLLQQHPQQYRGRHKADRNLSVVCTPQPKSHHHHPSHHPRRIPQTPSRKTNIANTHHDVTHREREIQSESTKHQKADACVSLPHAYANAVWQIPVASDTHNRQTTRRRQRRQCWRPPMRARVLPRRPHNPNAHSEDNTQKKKTKPAHQACPSQLCTKA